MYGWRLTQIPIALLVETVNHLGWLRRLVKSYAAIIIKNKQELETQFLATFGYSQQQAYANLK